ncbi:TetR/AcrR family transcriptional regulator [Burkholderia gladioli]|uniref:TetR/AcrR family transcriptional regulator n=1 Tax=Burkholderia gladioli TaxID=28095 RepID=UPI003F7A177B
MPKSPARNHVTPRKAPVQRRSAATVEALVEAAARILEREGPDAYTTNAVAARAGVSIGSLYQYFPNRDALTAALIERETGALLADFDRAIELPDCASILAAMVRAAVAHQLRRPALARLIDVEERRLPVEGRVGYVAARGLEAIAIAFGKPDAPLLAAPEVAARDVLAMVRGITDMAGEAGETDAAALERRALRAVFGYLRAEPGRTGL